MSKLKSLKETRAGIFTKIDELRTSADGREMTAEEQQRWDTLLSDYDKADKSVEAEERFMEIERRQAEQSGEQERSSDEQCSALTARTEQEYRAAFAEYLLRGATGITSEHRAIFEKRAGISGLNGGVIVPKTLSDSIEVALKSYGGMFEASSIIMTDKGGDLMMPTVNDSASKATVVAEYAQSTKKAPSFGAETLKAYTYRTPIVPVSQELLQDSDFALEPLISQLLSESFGRGMNEDLTIGSGTNKPKGILNWATASDAEPVATAIKLDDLIDLVRSVDSAYARRGRFMLNRNTLFSLMKIKDANGRYIWQDSASADIQPTLFGKSYIVNEDMPDIGAGNASVLFGDFSKFKIRMVRSFRVIRLNELLAEYLSIGLFGFARVDGILLDAGTHPVKKLVHKAS